MDSYIILLIIIYFFVFRFPLPSFFFSFYLNRYNEGKLCQRRTQSLDKILEMDPAFFLTFSLVSLFSSPPLPPHPFVSLFYLNRYNERRLCQRRTLSLDSNFWRILEMDIGPAAGIHRKRETLYSPV